MITIQIKGPQLADTRKLAERLATAERMSGKVVAVYESATPDRVLEALGNTFDIVILVDVP